MNGARPIGVAARIGLVLLLAGSLGCVRGCPSSRPPIHLNPNMDYQEKYEAQEQSAFFYDGGTMRLPVPGTVARGQLPGDPVLVTGKDASGAFVAHGPLAVDAERSARGAARFDIFCRPCHDARGTGKGILSERAGIPVPSFREQRVVDLADGEVFDVITHGKGLMPSYGYPIPVADRWAIVAHVRTLQQGGQAP